MNKPHNRLDRIRGHSLLPAAIKAKLPQLYATEGQAWQAVAQVKYFTPDSNWTWYGVEFDGQDLGGQYTLRQVIVPGESGPVSRRQHP